jgi:hypothetical protein
MQRRLFLGALAASALPATVFAQSGAPAPIQPENELERVFVAALTDPDMRPVFRRELLRSQVSLAMANSAPDSAPLELTFGELRTGAIFTSTARQSSVLGPASARRVLSGRQALQRLRGKNVVINMRLAPMLTLEAEDVAAYLAA